MIVVELFVTHPALVTAVVGVIIVVIYNAIQTLRGK